MRHPLVVRERAIVIRFEHHGVLRLVGAVGRIVAGGVRNRQQHESNLLGQGIGLQIELFFFASELAALNLQFGGSILFALAEQAPDLGRNRSDPRPERSAVTGGSPREASASTWVNRPTGLSSSVTTRPLTPAGMRMVSLRSAVSIAAS